MGSTKAPPASSLRRRQRRLLEALLQHAAHVRPDFIRLAAGELLEHAELAVELDDGSGRRLVHLQTLPDRLRRVIVALHQPLARDVISELAARGGLEVKTAPVRRYREWRLWRNSTALPS